MSISTSSEYKLMRKSHSLPHIASRHDSGVSNATASTALSGPGSCSILDQIDYDSAMCNDHQFDNNNHNPYQARNHLRHYNNSKYNNHNYYHHHHHPHQHHHHHHQQCENVRRSFFQKFMFNINKMVKKLRAAIVIFRSGFEKSFQP